MTEHSHRVRLASVLAVLAVAATAVPAAADDIVEIDGRLQDAGLDLAYTEAFDAVDRPGVRIVVDFDSGSEDEPAYRREAERAAELVWEHLDGRVLAVDVAPTYDVPWSDDGLPPAASFDRAALVERFGDRPAGLDDGDVETVGDGGLAFVGAALAGWLVSLLLVGTGTFFLTRARYRQRAVPTGSWGEWSAPASPPPVDDQAPYDPWRPTT